MENNVLGLKITRTSEGFSELLTINGAEYWCKNTRDVRPELDNIADFEKRTYVIMLSRTAGSCLLSVIIPISGRGGDNLCAWINVPDNIRISGPELESVVESVRKELMKNNRDDSSLKDLFSKQYETDPIKRPRFESSGDKVAYRLYGRGQNYSLPDLLGKINQPYYQFYKCVYFIDADSSARIKVGDDLSNKDLLSQLSIGPLQANDDGFEPYIHGMPFTKPVYVTEREKIEIVWKHKDKKYADIVHPYVIKSIEPKLSSPVHDEYRRLIPYGYFNVQDEEGKHVPEYRLYINGTELLKGHEIQVSESKVHECNVNVIAEGYEECDESKDLSRQCTISLKKKYYNYRLVVPAEHKDIEIVYKSDRPLKQSPLKGYALTSKMLSTNHPNRLKYSPYDKKFRRTALVIAAIVMCAGIFIGVSLPDMNFSKKTKHEQVISNDNNRKERSESRTDKASAGRNVEAPEESDAKTTPTTSSPRSNALVDVSSGKPSVEGKNESKTKSAVKKASRQDKKSPDSETKNQQTDQEMKSEDAKRGNDKWTK